jgi:hypothetical protein
VEIQVRPTPQADRDQRTYRTALGKSAAANPLRLLRAHVESSALSYQISTPADEVRHAATFLVENRLGYLGEIRSSGRGPKVPLCHDAIVSVVAIGRSRAHGMFDSSGPRCRVDIWPIGHSLAPVRGLCAGDRLVA